MMLGAFAHAGIFLISENKIQYSFPLDKGVPLDKGAIISHLSWTCLWLGFHTLGVYIHNCWWKH